MMNMFYEGLEIVTTLYTLNLQFQSILWIQVQIFNSSRYYFIILL